MTNDEILKHWHVVESSKSQFVIIDESAPKTEEFYYGMVADGFDTREQAEQYILDAAWTRHQEHNAQQAKRKTLN